MARGESYKEFTEKFKAKKTTDDCYTPENIYKVVCDWVVDKYNLDGVKIVRPFYPGGDYKSFAYSDNTVVIDNPPFSILSEIKDFYIKNNIKFFLFAPHLTIFSSCRNKICSVLTSNKIIYENKAVVNTSFITNLEDDDILIYMSEDLRDKINFENNKNRKKARKFTFKTPKYPENVITSAGLGKFICGETRIKRNECFFTRRLDDMKSESKTIFGGGFLVSDNVKGELLRNKAVLEERKPIKLQQEFWVLSEREREIIDGLSH